VRRASAADLILAFATEAVSQARLPRGAGRLLAVGWCTVETDRAVGELAVELGVAGSSFRAAHGSAALGASCFVADGPFALGVALAVLEPVAEGRIAAALARWDEGPLVAWYVVKPATAVEPDRLGGPGPFGPERLVPGDSLTGPHRLLVAHGTGTIRA
jgi:hypothetical protein